MSTDNLHYLFMRASERIEEADRIILTLTMDHNSTPNYLRGLEMAEEYFAKYRIDWEVGR